MSDVTLCYTDLQEVPEDLLELGRRSLSHRHHSIVSAGGDIEEDLMGDMSGDDEDYIDDFEDDAEESGEVSV